MRGLWLSLHPRWATSILSGRKTVELRRRAPDIGNSARVVLYATSPTRAVVGTSKVVEVATMPLEELWSTFGEDAAVTRDEFEAYFVGTSEGTAIVLQDSQTFEDVVPLAELRRRGQQPAQGWRYVDGDSMEWFFGLQSVRA